MPRARKSPLVSEVDPELTVTSITTPLQSLVTGARDSMGFLTGSQPDLTDTQVTWLSYRLDTGNDEEATARSGIDPAAWSNDSEFIRVYQMSVGNKREGFKYLGTQMLGKALRVISQLLDRALNENDVRAAQTALNMLLRSQGMLIDSLKVDSKSDVANLFELLRQEQPVTVEAIRP